MGETQSRPAERHNNTQIPLRKNGGVLPLGSILEQAVSTAAPRTRCDDDNAPPPPPLPTSAERDLPSSSATAAPPPPPGTSTDSIEEAAKSVSSFQNPGPYEQAANDGKRLVMLETFDGFRCEINKQVSPFMAVIHSFHLGTTSSMDGRKNIYSFLTQVADESSMYMARVNPGLLSVDGRIHKAIGPFMGKLQVGVSPEGQGDQMVAEIDVGAHTWAANLKYGSMGGGNVYGMNYMQAVTPNLALGGEGMYIAANQNMLSAYTAKYNWTAKTDDVDVDIAVSAPKAPQPGAPPPEVAGASTLIATYNTAQASACLNYKRTVTPNRLTLGAELNFSPLSLESQLVAAAEFKWQRSKLNLAVDGGGRIQSLLEAKYGMGPGSPTLMFSADMDHFKEEMKFGYGITIDS